ncbi:MAG: hypothetical protein JOZ87_05670 [Chloroflexi bacterium]|nr:hypothetical protein [Chloroflexota bacterium]
MRLLVRPDGQVLVADVVTDPRYPSFDPPLPIHETIWELLFAAARQRGATIDAARRLPNLCEEAGLRVIDARGGFQVIRDAKRPIEATRLALESARRAVVDVGLATDAQIDALMQALIKAADQQFRCVLGNLFVWVIAQVPSA